MWGDCGVADGLYVELPGTQPIRVFFSPYLGLTEEEQMRFRFYEEGFSG